MGFLYGKADIQSLERRDNTDNQVLKEIESHNNTSKTHLSNANTHLSNIKTNSDTTASKLTNIQNITDTKLSAIQNFLDKDHAQFIHKHKEALLGSDDGTTSGNKVPIRVDSDGKLIISNPSGSSDSTASNQLTIISNQTTGNTSLSNIDGKVSTETKQDTIITNQTTGNTHLSNIKTNSDTMATKLTNIQTINDGKLSAIQNSLDKDHAQFIHKHKEALLGSDDGTTSGNKVPIRVDGNGRLSVDINSGVATTTSNSFLGATNIGTLVIGKDSSNNSRTIQTDSDGKLIISNPSSATSDASASNQNTIISNQGTANTSLSSIDSKVSTSANQTTSISHLNDIKTSSNSIDSKVSTSANQTTIISNQTTGNTSLSNIDGKVSTSANQTTGNNSLSSIDSKVSTAANQATANTSLSNINTLLTSIEDSNKVKRDVTTISSTTLNAGSNTSSVDIDGYKGLHWRFVSMVSSGGTLV